MTIQDLAFQSQYNNDIWRNGTGHPGEMALATLASAISQDIIILMTLPIWS